jgi:hypothetical protein
MLDSATRSCRLDGRFGGRWASSLTVVALALLVATPALAGKKKAADAPAADDTAPAADGKPTAPAPDSFGRVHFGPPSAPDLGRVTVKAPAADKLQVFLEGRYFGDAPLTIYSVPKGDYIVEGTYPDGKTVSRPVSVIENEEAVADLTGARAAEDAKNAKPMFATQQISPARLTATKVFVIGGAAALVAGIVFGILEKHEESLYQTTPDTTQLDSIQNRGKTYALVANVGFALAAVGLVGTAVCAYPMIMHPAKEGPALASSSPTFVVVPGSSSVNGAVSLRF